MSIKYGVVRLKMHVYHRGISLKRGPRHGAGWNAQSSSIVGLWSSILPESYNTEAPHHLVLTNGPTAPQPKPDQYRVFTGGDLIVYGTEEKESSFESRSLQADGTYGIYSIMSEGKGEMFSPVKSRAAEYFVNAFAGVGNVEGTFAARRRVRLSELGVHEGATLMAHAHESMADTIVAAAKAALAKVESFYEVEPSSSEPSYDTINTPSNTKVDLTFNTSGVTVAAHGPGSVDFEVPCYAVYNGSTIVLYDVLPLGIDTSADAARAAANAWDESFKRAFVQKSEGREFIRPTSVRPPETTSKDLAPEQLAHYDDWWARSQEFLRALDRPMEGGSDAGYNRYVASGGSASREDWLAGGASRENAAASLPNGGFWSGVGGVLGTTGEHLVDGVKWLGNSTVDLLKDWGPTGTLQVYGGVKAVDAVTGPSFEKYLPWILIGFGALLVLR